MLRSVTFSVGGEGGPKAQEVWDEYVYRQAKYSSVPIRSLVSRVQGSVLMAL